MRQLLALILRHGETEANAADVFRARLDPPLDDNGLKQAEKAAEFISENYDVWRIICSPMLRAVQTADIVSELVDAPVEQDRGLICWNLGFLAGKPKEDYQGILDHFVDNPTEKIPDGESLDDFEERIEEFFYGALKLENRSASDLVQIGDGLPKWALSFVGGKDTRPHGEPKSCFNCPFMFLNQHRCQIMGPDIIIDRAQWRGETFSPVCTYQRGGQPRIVEDKDVVYNADVLGAKSAEQAGLEWARSATGTNCYGFKDGAPCKHFVPTKPMDDEGIVDGICAVMERSDWEVDSDDCCNSHSGSSINFKLAQKILKGERDAEGEIENEFTPDKPKVMLFVAHTSNVVALENLIKGNRDGRPESGDVSVGTGGIAAIYLTDDGYDIEPVFGEEKVAEFGS